MKRLTIALPLLLAFTLLLPVRQAEAGPLIRNSVQACAFGAGTLAAATYVRLVPALTTGFALPVTEAIAANALIGCGIGVAGAVSATVVSWIYDGLF